MPISVNSVTSGSFSAPYSGKAGLKSLKIATRLSDSISDGNLSVQYIELPSIERLVPDVLP